VNQAVQQIPPDSLGDEVSLALLSHHFSRRGRGQDCRRRATLVLGWVFGTCQPSSSR
jgi:hypothetical protein